jgi:hypothetical protein
VAISREELLRLARAGATARVKELQDELESIYRTFPDLRGGGRRAAPRAAAASAKPTSRRATAGGATKRAWSAADRKAVSERMKKYWAQRRAKTAKPTK